MLNTIKMAGKYLDQPLLVGKFSKAVPATLIAGSALYTAHEVKKAPEGHKKQAAINTALVLGATSAAALAAPRVAAKVVGRPFEKVNLNKIRQNNTKLVDEFLSSNKVSKPVETILDKARTKVLKIKEIATLNKEIGQTENGKKFMNAFVPEPENVTSKDIVKDMARLSILGAMPVAGGIAGGIAGDMITDKPNWKKKLPNKIKEGAYQYLANIFLCNVGAAGALGILEAAKVKSKAARAGGMVAGILATGVIGGSTIANYISKKVINPLFDGKNAKKADKNEGLYSERKPEALDLCLHSDDIATIAVMSGFKWIEPSLPILYAISGYRSGIGYRNGDKGHHKQAKVENNNQQACLQKK